MTQDTPVDAVVAGHICLDIIPTVGGRELSFRPGTLVEIGAAVVSTGGPVSNTGVALHILGARTALMGKTGNDALGQTLRSVLTARSPELGRTMAVAEGEATSYTVILSPPGQDRMFLHCPGCNNTFGADDIDYELVSKARVFHFGYPPIMRRMMIDGGAELAEVLRRAKESGATVSLDMCMPDTSGLAGKVDWSVILAAALPFVDVFLPSLEEISVMLRDEETRSFTADPGMSLPDGSLEQLHDVAGRLLDLGPAVVGLKLGAAGLYLRTSDSLATGRLGRLFARSRGNWRRREIWSPCFAVEVVGTTGSGDATIAGFLAGLLRRHSPEECLTMACAVGGCSVEAADAAGGIRGWEETARRVSSGWARRAPSRVPAGWSAHPAGVYLGPGDNGESLGDRGYPPEEVRGA